MANLTVWKFHTVDGAQQALGKLAALQKEHLIEVVDAAIVTWPTGKKKPKTKQAFDLTNWMGHFGGCYSAGSSLCRFLVWQWVPYRVILATTGSTMSSLRRCKAR